MPVYITAGFDVTAFFAGVETITRVLTDIHGEHELATTAVMNTNVM